MQVLGNLCAALLTSMGILNHNSQGPSEHLHPKKVPMTLLQHSARFADNIINVRLASPLLPNEELVIFIPGGPAISGKYMDALAHSVSKQLGRNVAVIDLPNHDDSRDTGKTENLKYPEVRAILLKLFTELSNNGSRKISLVGHSLGALIALDLAGQSQIEIEKMVLMNMPTTFSVSDKFQIKKQELGLSAEFSINSESQFQAWWNKVLTLYFSRPLLSDEYNLLANHTFWSGNELIQSELPTFNDLINVLNQKKLRHIIYYLEGMNDIRVPDENMEEIKRKIPNVHIKLLSESAHFSMLEKPVEVSNWISENL